MDTKILLVHISCIVSTTTQLSGSKYLLSATKILENVLLIATQNISHHKISKIYKNTFVLLKTYAYQIKLL